MGAQSFSFTIAVVVVGPVAPAVVVVVMEDDAEAAGVVVEVVQGSGELDAGGVFQGSGLVDCGEGELSFEGGLDFGELNARWDGKDGVAAELRIAEEFVGSEAAAGSERDVGASGDAGWRDGEASGEAVAEGVGGSGLRELRLDGEPLAVKPIGLLDVEEAGEDLFGSGNGGEYRRVAGDHPGLVGGADVQVHVGAGVFHAG